MKKYLMLAGIFLCWSQTVLADVTAVLSENKVREGETFFLSFRSADESLSDWPNLQALKNDFEIVNQNQRSEMRYFNGKQRTLSELTLSLRPINVGKITIPSFEVNGQKTKPLTVEVIPASSELTAEKEENPRLFIRSEPKVLKGYVGEALLYKIKLFSNDDLRGELFAPRAKDVNMLQFDEDKQYRENVKGKTYDVIERDYYLFPTKSGEIKITGSAFRGTIPDSLSKHESDTLLPFGFSTDILYYGRMNEKPVYLKAPESVIEAKPLPQGVSLVAEDVTLSEKYAPEKTEFKSGDSFSREIILTTVGTLPDFLPSLAIPEQKGFRIYPGEEIRSHTFNDGKLISSLKQTFVFVPVKSGSFTLSPLKVVWMNIKTGEKRETVLPSKTFRILTKDGKKAIDTQKTPKKQISKITVAKQPLPVKVSEVSLFRLIAIFVIGMILGALILGGIVLWMINHKKKQKKVPLKPLYPY